jgi:hypothetical protein
MVDMVAYLLSVWPLVGRSIAVTMSFPGALVGNLLMPAAALATTEASQPKPSQAVRRPGSVGKKDQALVVVAMEILCLANACNSGVGVTESEAIQRFRSEPKIQKPLTAAARALRFCLHIL